jgi:hypothetical protein
MRVLAISLVASIGLVTSAFAASTAAGAGDERQGFRTPRFDALEARIDSIAGRSDDWSGSLRYRWEARRQAGAFGDTGFRQGIELRLGGEHRLNDELALGFRLSAFNAQGWGGNVFGLPQDTGAFEFGGLSVRETRSMGGRATQGLGLDRAYVRYTPGWAGDYETADGEDAPRLEVTAGAI